MTRTLKPISSPTEHDHSTASSFALSACSERPHRDASCPKLPNAMSRADLDRHPSTPDFLSPLATFCPAPEAGVRAFDMLLSRFYTLRSRSRCAPSSSAQEYHEATLSRRRAGALDDAFGFAGAIAFASKCHERRMARRAYKRC